MNQPQPIRAEEAEAFRAAAHQAVDWIADYLRDAGTYPVTPQVSPGFLIDQLPSAAPETGEPLANILADFRNLIVPGITHWNHPRFLAYFSISGSGPGILAEMLSAALNVNHMLWKTSPAATELEQITLGWLRQWLGLPSDFFGIIHDTASTATLHAVLAARHQAAPQGKQTGDYPPLAIYCSEHAHSSVDKSVLALGTGLQRIRHVPADAQFRMRTDELTRRIAEDRKQGITPCCLIGTVGTTSAASIDPLPELAKIAEGENLWFHVDAAYAGPAAMLEEHRHILNGAAQADSLVTNPHKWLFTPVDLSALYTRKPEAFRAAVNLEDAPPYLTAADQAVNLADYSLALGRRFRSLKLWFVMRHFGRAGIAAVLRNHIRMAQDLARRIQQHPGFELILEPLFSLVCFRLRATDDHNRALLERINATHQAFLSGTTLNSRFVLRIAIGNLGTSDRDIDEVWDLIQRSAAELR